ncbi:hypothetical protein PRIPAC_82040 [Pristionchus pacificus]|uniref:PGM_PMM_I domain-containing protein n=1 Tax=Pristionchus pacificus TaxID=54126 RepID=A0A2A6BXY5_PRIPA|nr:hypothetical protein PRIPAC_82040 [Pristionchus pacificus]|eukprot:PDM70729.1 hypothetical protein PRIPAC_44933 [Pristionchus pacificus]
MSSDRLPSLMEPFHQLHSSTYEEDKRQPLMYPYKMHYQVDGGIILTASQNPGGPKGDFGIKFNCENGGPAPDHVTDAIHKITTEISSYSVCRDINVDTGIIGHHEFDVDGMGKYIVDVIDKHWAEYGRNVFTRYDYENVESGGANLLMTFLEASMNASKGKELSANGVTYKVAHTDNFEYTDPVDGSVAKKQGLRVLFEDGSRLVFRLCGTGSAGATIRFYVDSYVSPHDTNKLYSSAQDLLKPLVLIALDLCKMDQFTGRKAPTVIT